MNKIFKYLIVQYPAMPDEPVWPPAVLLFPTFIVHSIFAAGLPKGTHIVSAGFANEEFQCFGGSDSLALNSREEVDTALLLAFLVGN